VNSSAQWTAALAGHRARTVAAIARKRAASPAPIPNARGRAALRKIADLLDVAALVFESEPPTVIDGAATTRDVPTDARLALADAEREAASHPTIGFPAQFGQYVTQPVLDKDVVLPPSLQPKQPNDIAREADLFSRLFAVHAQLAMCTMEEVTDALLEAAFTLHWKLAHLRNALRAAATDPVEIPAPATPMALGRAHEEHGPVLNFAIVRKAPCYVSVDGRTHPADRMVSYQGATIATCEEHEARAVGEARSLYDALD
jgi:hypothetical protein